MNDWIEVLLRTGAALTGSMLLGLNRELHGKPTGMRTLGLVGLSSSVVALVATSAVPFGGDIAASSRLVQGVIQGILTGVGFLGAGVILRDAPGMRVHGLTTAATVLVTAALGIAFGLGQWILAGTGLGLALLVLTFGGPLEHALRRWLKQPLTGPSDDDAAPGG